MIKNVLAVLALALALGFAASLGTGAGRSAEAASSNPAITTAAPVSADLCTSTQTSYGYGYYGGFYGYGGPIPYGGPVPFGGFYGYPYQPMITAPGAYGQSYASYSCNFTQCQPVPYYTVFVVCPGPPAGITMPASPTTVTCASASDITVTVLDANGLRVADGTEVDFSTTFGMITAVTQTQDGLATASLNTPTKQTGTASITVRSGSATNATPMNITVTCNAPGSTAGGQTQASQAAPVVPAYMAPSGPSYSGYGY